MNTLMTISKGLIVYTVTNIGFTALLTSITAIHFISTNIYEIIRDISKLNNSDIQDKINDLDLEMTIKLLNIELNNINNDNNTPELENYIKYMKEDIKNIEQELIKLNEAISYNESLWYFKNLRSYDYSEFFKKLKKYKNRIENRKKMLRETLEIKYYFNS